MNAKARLTEILDRRMEPTRPSLVAGLLADAVLAEFDLTPKPPQPAGPVTSEEAVVAYEVAYNARRGGFLWFDPIWRIDGRHCFDAAMPLLARDHGLLTPAEVERRARAWWSSPYGRPVLSGVPDSLVTALTASAATGAASTASSPPVCASCGERKEKCNGC